jgi:hypothetical protein
MNDFDPHAASRAVSIPAQVDAHGHSGGEATGDTPPASAEDRNLKDRGRQDAVGSISDNDPSHALSTQADQSVGLEAPRVLAATLHLKRPAPSGVARQSFSHGRSRVAVIEKVKRRFLAPSERPDFPARSSAADGGGAKVQDALSEPAAKNPSQGSATAAASNAPTSGDDRPARGCARSKTTRPGSTIPLPVASRGLLTEGAVATRLSLSPATLRNWRVKGLGPAFVRLSRRAVRYEVEVVDEWIAARARRTTSDKCRENG